MNNLNDKAEELEGTRTRYLLPIKTNDGLVQRAVTENG